MRKIVLTVTVFAALFSCTKNDEAPTKEQTQDQTQLLTKEEINTIIKTSLEETGTFKWSQTDALTIWSAANYGEHIITVGYNNSEVNRKTVNRKTGKSLNNKEDLITLVRNLEGSKLAAKGETKELYTNDKINVFDIEVTSKATIEALLKDERVRYVEPSAYKFSEHQQKARSGAGCGFEGETISSTDYRTIAPGAMLPWAFDLHNIPAAWNYSTGSGVTVAVIDTGLTPDQSLMNSDFNDGYSSGRTVEKKGTYVDSWWAWSNNYDGVDDKCGHGTSMTSVAVAPRNDNNLPVGVAYNANLISYRAVSNVLIDDYHERRGIAEALTDLADRSDVKVVSMSIGSLTSSGTIEDAIRYAYNRGKMIVCAAGTSTSFTNWYGVIFPASMNETVAVTGVKEGQYSRCDICHSGSKVDFTIQMERSGSGKKIPILGYYNGQGDYVGGSSVATATTAGIAALVWSKHPNWTRAQVLQKLRESSDFYPNKNSEFGYGNIDALKAVQ